MLGRRIRLIVWMTGTLLAYMEPEAQYYFYNDRNYASDWILESGGAAGIMNCLTDLGGRKGIGKGGIKDLNWRVTKPCLSLYFMATYKEAFAWRLEGSLGSIASYDGLLKKTDPGLAGRYGRNLSFRSGIADLQLGVEIHPLFFRRYDQDKAPYCSPYLVAGIGYYWFSPRAFLQNQWYDLHPLRLEGQGFVEYPGHSIYRLRQVNIPVGIGLRYEAGSWVNMRLEIVHRALFTDYLDDVSNDYIDPLLFDKYLPPDEAAIAKRLYSRMGELQPGLDPNASMQRGDPGNNDAFFSILIKIGLLIRPGRTGTTKAR